MEGGRYSRQVLFEPLGITGQQRLSASSVVIVGCGALGTVIANCLARSGIGKMKIVDRDYVEMENLQRQVLFDEDDALKALPKALAAVSHLRAINSEVELIAEVRDLRAGNAESLLGGCDLVMDATDNLETRFVINDACVKAGTPWVHGAALGSVGMEMPIIPERTACYRCYLRELPGERLPGCDVMGILNPVTGVIGCIQSGHAIRILVGGYETRNRMIYVDLWTDEFLEIEVERNEDCPCCGLGIFSYLEKKQQTAAVTLCGRDAIQVSPPDERKIELEELSRDLARSGRVHNNGFLITFRTEGEELVIFPDGRAIIKGARDRAHARSLYSRFVSN